MLRSKQYYIRKSHRWLGLLLGIQFLFWTIGGIYFSWNDIDEVHGDFEVRHVPLFESNFNLVSPSTVLSQIQQVHPIDSLVSIQLINIVGKPYYQIKCMSNAMPKTATAHHALMIHLADAQTGELRGPLTRQEATKVAQFHLIDASPISKVEYLTAVGKHHEYRESPLPAYAVTFNKPSNVTIYVSTELGTVQRVRNNKWRVFDILWMMHTMDYEGRDNFGNLLLKIFSVFGLVTVLSGFLLFWYSSKWGKPSRANK